MRRTGTLDKFGADNIHRTYVKPSRPHGPLQMPAPRATGTSGRMTVDA
jgi:hypothetical protein